MNIRKATLSDETEVFDLLRKLLSPQATDSSRIHTPVSSRIFHEIITDESKGTVIVAEEDGKLVGVITLSYPIAIRCVGKYTCIEEFIVSETMRGRGVGSQLLEAALNEAKKQDCFEIQVNNPSELGYPLYIRQDIKDAGKHLKKRLRDNSQ
ncbi:MAG TPA: GNAT family N-acetyltransferase [Dehalococcoidales bacterium]